MTLCHGDIVQYKQLQKLSIGEYLIKLSNFVDQIEIQLKK